MRCCGGRTRRRTPRLRSTPGGTGCSSAWRRSPSRPPTATTPPGGGSGAGERRPVSFLGRPTAPAEEGEPTEGGDDHGDQDDREEIAGGTTARTPPCRRRWRRPNDVRRTIRGSRSGRSRPTHRRPAWWSSSRPRQLSSWWRGRCPTSTWCSLRCWWSRPAPPPYSVLAVVGVTDGAAGASAVVVVVRRRRRRSLGRRHLCRCIADLCVGRRHGRRAGRRECPARSAGTSTPRRHQPGWTPTAPPGPSLA